MLAVTGLVKDGANLSLKRVKNVQVTQESTQALARGFIKLLPHIVTKAEYTKEREIVSSMMKVLFLTILKKAVILKQLL